MNYLKQRIGKILGELEKRIVEERLKITGIKLCECGYKNGTNTPPPDAVWRDFAWGESFGGSFEWHGWFHATLTVPEQFRGKNVELYNWASRQSPQFITFLDGKTVQGMDPNHRSFPLDSEQSVYDLLSYVYVGYNSDVSEYCPELRVIDTETKKLYWDMRVPYDVMCFLPEEGIEYCNMPDGKKFCFVSSMTFFPVLPLRKFIGIPMRFTQMCWTMVTDFLTLHWRHWHPRSAQTAVFWL